MSKRSDRPQTARHVYLYDEDWEYLESAFGRGAPVPLAGGISQAVKTMIHTWVTRLRAREEAAVPVPARSTEQ